MVPDFRRTSLTTTAKVFDFLVVCFSFLASFIISSGSFTWPDLADVLVIRIKVVNFLLFVGYLALCLTVFSACGFYRSHRLSQWKQRLGEMIFAVTFVTGAFLVVQQLFRISFAMNVFLPWFWFFTLCGLVLSHELAMRLLRVARIHGRNLRNVVVIAEGPEAIALADRVSQEAALGYRILRIIDAGEMRENGRIVGDI